MVGARPALKPPVDMAKRPELDRKKLVEAPQNPRKEAVSEKKKHTPHGWKTGIQLVSNLCGFCWLVCVFLGGRGFIHGPVVLDIDIALLVKNIIRRRTCKSFRNAVLGRIQEQKRRAAEAEEMQRKRQAVLVFHI